MPLSPMFAVTQRAVAQILLAPDLAGVLCTFEHIITPLNMLGDAVGNDEFAQVDHKLMMSAFQSGDREYIIPYKDLGISDEASHVLHYLLVRIGKRVSRSRTVYEFGRFTIDAKSSDTFTIHSDIIPTGCHVNTTLSHPLGKRSFTKNLGDRIHKDTSDELGKFLKLRSIDQKNRLVRDKRKMRAG